MAGLLDFIGSPGALNIAQGLLAASGPSRMPVSTGQALGAGIANYQQGLIKQQDYEMKKKLFDLQVAAAEQQQKQQAQKQAALASITAEMDPNKVALMTSGLASYSDLFPKPGAQGVGVLTDEQEIALGLPHPDLIAYQRDETGKISAAYKPPEKTLAEVEDRQRMIKKVPKLAETAKKDPEKVYAAGYRMEDSGELYRDPETGAPVKLEGFDKMAATDRAGIRTASNLWKSANTIGDLLKDPAVRADLDNAAKAGVLTDVESMATNKFKLWLQQNGIAPKGKTSRLITMMQRLASEQRKEFLGSAISLQELKGVTPWLPDAGDSYQTMLTKMDAFLDQGEMEFRNYLDLNKDTYNMYPAYKLFGINRFDSPKPRVPLTQQQPTPSKPVNMSPGGLQPSHQSNFDKFIVYE